MGACWWACRCRRTRCASSAHSCASSATPTLMRRATPPTAFSWAKNRGPSKEFRSRVAIKAENVRLVLNCDPGSELVALDDVGVADRRGESAAFATLRHAEVGEALGIAAVDAALGDDVVHWDVPGLREDGVEARELVGHSDDHRPLREAGKCSIEETSAVAQPVALHIPAVHRQKDRVGLHLGRADRIRNVQRTVRKLHAGMPFAKYERLLRCDDHRQRCQRAPLSERSGKMASVVLAFDRPTKSEAATGKSGERKLQMTVDAPAHALELDGAQGHARRDQSLAVRLAPILKYGRGCRHGNLSLMFSRELRNLFAVLLLALPLAGLAAPGDEAVLGAY